MEGRVSVVTGAAGAIGQAICAGLARKGAEVVMLCRTEARARDAVTGVSRAVSGCASRLRGEAVDLSNRGEILAFVRRMCEEKRALHVLINNAAVAPRRRCMTKDGIEEQLAVNVLSYYLLTRGLEPLLKASAPSRVVMVASYWAGGLDVNDLQFERRSYDNDSAYRQSKAANRMLAVAFSERLKKDGVCVNAAHPGDVRSTLSNSLGFGGHESPEEAARTPLLLATEPLGGEVSGKYFQHGSESRCSYGSDAKGVAALWQECERLCPGV